MFTRGVDWMDGQTDFKNGQFDYDRGLKNRKTKIEIK